MTDRVIVITGASSGIGEASALLLAGRGHSLVIVARRSDALQAVADRCHGRARPIAADMSQRSEVQRVVGESLAAFGRIDVWINNVGQGITRPPSQLTDEDIDLMMRVNVKSALYGMQEPLTHFRQRGGGHFINVSSILGRIPYAMPRSAYCAAKHFLNALTATFREEVQATDPGIQFTLVSPGVVWTNFGANALHGGPDSRAFPEGQTPEQVAEVIASVVDSRAPDVYTRGGMREWVVGYYSTVGTDPGL
jgi:NADP-dependent 3-hydroxy acid dehydrogenase YdfG